MKILASGLLATTLLIGAAVTQADSNTKAAGKTIKSGANGVGHGISKIYHDAAHGVHKIIAKNTRDPHTRAVHWNKASRQHTKASKQQHKSTHDLKTAKRASH